MKKYILLSLTLMLVCHVQAQSLWDISKPDHRTTFGIRVGYNTSNMTGETEVAGTRPGFNAGLSFDYNIIKSISITTGVYYSMKGFGSHYEDQANTSYVQIPLQGSYRIETPTGVMFHFNIGPYFAYGLGGNAKLSPQNLSNFLVFDQKAFGEYGFFRRFDYGLTAGAYIHMSHVLLGINYDFGMADVSKVFGKLHNRNMSITLGYNF